MRLFTAIRLPGDVRDHLYEYLDVLRSVRDDLRWVPPDNLHLTVRFLGECGPREADRQIEHWARRCGAVRPFELALSGAGCFPHTWMAKVLFAAVAGADTGWARLAGGEGTPHVTIARARQALDLTGVLHELAAYRSRAWTAEDVTMYQSFTQSGRAPRYVPLETFELGSGNDVPE